MRKYYIFTVMKRVSIHDAGPKRVWELHLPLHKLTPDFCRKITDRIPITMYNHDLTIFQHLYQYQSLFLFPFCQAKIQHDTERITKLEVIDNLRTIHYPLPVLKTLELSVNFVSTTQKSRIKSFKVMDPATNIAVTFAGQTEIELITSLSEWLAEYNPDVLLTHGGDADLRYLGKRAIELGLGHLSLSKDPEKDSFNRIGKVKRGSSFMSYGGHYHKHTPVIFHGGRLHIDLRNSFTWQDGGFEGLVELSRMSGIDPQRCARTSIGTNLTGIQIRQALAMNVLIPPKKADVERFRTGESLLLGDRGGFIHSPQVGIHFNVFEMDFASMFPQIMCKYNISPETLNCECCGVEGNHIPGTENYTCRKRKGIVPLSLQPVLDRRMYYKENRHQNPSYNQLQKTLKWILVCCFGYQGFRNARFGRIESHEAINAFAREFLLQTKEIVEDQGFDVIAGIIDSIWGKFPDERVIDAARLEIIAKDIQTQTKLPMNVEGVYRWIIFLPRKQESEVGVLNRYYGCFEDGTVKIRGIELRRRDACKFIKRAQEMGINCLKPARNISEFKNIVKTEFWMVHDRFQLALSRHTISVEDFLITKVISKEPFAYRQLNHQAIASQQLIRAGKPMSPGMKVQYLVIGDRTTSRNNRVIVKELLQSKHRPDIRWYSKKLTEAFSNLLPPAIIDNIRIKSRKSLYAYF